MIFALHPFCIDQSTANSHGSEIKSISGASSSNGASDLPIEPIVREERRTKLPVAAPSGSEVPSLWGILRKNIGKDLSRKIHQLYHTKFIIQTNNTEQNDIIM